MNKAIISDNAPAAVGPYVHAIEAGNTLYCSGQLGLDPATGEPVNGVQEQALQALRNMEEVLKTAGYASTDVVKTLIFLADINDFGSVNEIYEKFFGDHKPARSCVQVGALPKGGLVEIECVAVK